MAYPNKNMVQRLAFKAQSMCLFSPKKQQSLPFSNPSYSTLLTIVLFLVQDSKILTVPCYKITHKIQKSQEPTWILLETEQLGVYYKHPQDEKVRVLHLLFLK